MAIAALLVCLLDRNLLSPLAAQSTSNRVLSVSGFGDAMLVPPDVFNGLQDFTIEFLFSRQTANSSSTEFSVTGDQISMSIAASQGPGPHIGLNLSYQDQLFQTSSTQLPLRNWTHFAATRAQNQMELYLDGTLVQSVTHEEAQPLLSGLKRALFGASQDSQSAGLIGYLDEIRIWRTVRTAAQIEASLKLKNTRQEHNPDLVAYWHFDDGDANDHSGNAHHGALLEGAKLLTMAIPYPTIEASADHLFGQCIDHLNAPVFRAQVTATYDDGDLFTTETDDQGQFAIPRRPSESLVQLSAKKANAGARLNLNSENQTTDGPVATPPVSGPS